VSTAAPRTRKLRGAASRAGIADRYYPSQPAEDIAESFVQEGFTAVRISITNVIARSGLG
jgi:hypothetical protein